MRRKVSYDSNLLRSGHKYFFKVRSRVSWFADRADSNVISFVWFDPAAATGKVTAVPGDRQVTLTWQPVTLKNAGKDLAVKYQVLRSLDGKDFTKIDNPLAATSYIDRQVSNNQKYLYSVRTLTEYKNELAEGGVSKEVAATPIDLTPPVPPTGVTAVRTDAGIKIFWDRSDATDLSGYRIYRRASDRDGYEMLGKVEPMYTLFVDTKAGESVRYYYAITALDGATPANESSKSKEATIRD
jgi:fibronectin type 3 domain-containing protein